MRIKSGSRAGGCRLLFGIRKTATPLTTCGGQNLRAKEKRTGTQPDTLIEMTPRALLDFASSTPFKSARVLIESSKNAGNLQQGGLCSRIVKWNYNESEDEREEQN